MRSKEDAQDYRYFPDPDLVPIHISEEWLDTIKEAQPEFKDEKMLSYKEECGIPDYDINMITDSKKLADIFEETTALCNTPKKVSNWLITETMRILKEKNMDPEDITFSPKSLARIIELADEGSINRKKKSAPRMQRRFLKKYLTRTLIQISILMKMDLSRLMTKVHLRQQLRRL